MSGGQQVCPREVQTLSVKILTGESRKVCLLLWESDGGTQTQTGVPGILLGSGHKKVPQTYIGGDVATFSQL